MVTAAPGFRMMLGVHGHRVTHYDMTAGGEDTFGDPTFTFSSTTITILMAPIPFTRDDDFVSATGRFQQESRLAFVESTVTVKAGDEIYADFNTTRYRVIGVIDVPWHNAVAYKRLSLREMSSGMQSTT